MTDSKVLIKKCDIDVLKHFGRPPRGVKDVLTAVLILLGYSEMEAKDWYEVKAVMRAKREEGLLARCGKLDANSLSTDKTKKAKHYLGLAGSFEQITRMSAAASGLYVWADSMAGQSPTSKN